MVISKQSVEVSDELLPVREPLIIKVDLAEKLKVGVQVHWDVDYGRFIDQLHHVGILMEVGCALDKVVHCQRARSYA